jgi:probable HAF family extracellular repeat protein
MQLTKHIHLVTVAGALTVLAATGLRAQYHAAQDLGTLNGGSYNFATSINDSGTVVGFAELTTEPVFVLSIERAFIYSGGAMTEIGALASIPSAATGINDSGTVVGEYDTGSNGSQHNGFIYSNGSLTTIGSLGGAIRESARCD